MKRRGRSMLIPDQPQFLRTERIAREGDTAGLELRCAGPRPQRR